MVKLFVGNLADSVDTHRLRNLFLQYAQVQECDVLKNFAFVHVISEEDAELCIQKLHKTTLEGREVHIERSTSKLRKEPGMSDKCFTCGATDHKTPNCPQELVRRKKRGLEDDGLMLGPDGKKPAILPTINLAAGSGPILMQPAISNWGCKIGGGNDADPELPCPTNPELRTLYEQYMDARTKYFFYRERLSKELSLQPASIQNPMHMRFDMTKGIPQSGIKQEMYMQQPNSVPAVQYSAPPANYQPSPYAAVPQSIHSVPASAYASRPQGYSMPASQQPQLQSSVSSSMYSSQAPTAPYNTMSRQPTSVNYATYQSAPAPPTLQPQNGNPTAPYSSNAPYRNAPYATSGHSYNTVQR